MSTNKSNNYRRMLAPIKATTPACITQRSRSALLPFALLPSTQSEDHANQHAPAPQLLNQLHHARLTLITGRSGSGKSTLLRALQQPLPNTITPSDLPRINQSLPIVNLFNEPLNQTLSLLGSAGLAEPKLWVLPQRALSTGEQARLQIARLIHHAQQRKQPNDIILLDEFCSNLDRLTAQSLCASLNKLITRSPSLSIIAAAAHEDLPTYLNTDLLIHAMDRSILPSQYIKPTTIIEPGTIDDYHALKHHHYLGSDPRSIARIDRALRTCPITHAPILAAVLVVTYPTLNASWRDRAWPHRYTAGTKSQNAKRINNELRRIARVIVAPHSRGLGIATTLVRNYLANPLTPATEAIAAMGSISPFFKNAGMTEYPIPHSPTDHRLLDCLHHLNQSPTDLLYLPLPGGESRGEVLLHSVLHPLLLRELQTWARAKNLNPDDPNLPTYAAFKLLTQPRAYTHAKEETAQ